MLIRILEKIKEKKILLITASLIVFLIILSQKSKDEKRDHPQNSVLEASLKETGNPKKKDAKSINKDEMLLLDVKNWLNRPKLIYRRNGRRDPFNPLIFSQKGKSRTAELELMCIIWDEDDPVAMIKFAGEDMGKIVRKGDLIKGKRKIVDIQENSVTLLQGEKEVILRLRK